MLQEQYSSEIFTLWLFDAVIEYIRQNNDRMFFLLSTYSNSYKK